MNLIFNFLKFICFKINLIDQPNKIKVHRNPVPLIGGILFLLTLMFVDWFYNIKYYNFYLILIIGLIGILDDIKNLKPNFKLLITFITILLIVSYDTSLQIKFINFKLLNSLYFPNNIFLNILLPTLCLMLLLNAFNMSDGINGLAILIFLSWSAYLTIKLPVLFYTFLPFIIISLFFIIYNLSGKAFLGDGGNYMLSMLIGGIIIKQNNIDPSTFIAEEIFLILFIPGIDMLRLFIERIRNKKNPFIGDKNHLHHYLFKKYGNTKTLIIYLFYINFPLYLYFYFTINLGILLLFSFITYLLLIKIRVLKKI